MRPGVMKETAIHHDSTGATTLTPAERFPFRCPKSARKQICATIVQCEFKVRGSCSIQFIRFRFRLANEASSAYPDSTLMQAADRKIVYIILGRQASSGPRPSKI
jgi:hypothetical protein